MSEDELDLVPIGDLVGGVEIGDPLAREAQADGACKARLGLGADVAPKVESPPGLAIVAL